VQIRAPRAINGAGVLTVERLDVTRSAGRIFQIHVRQSFPAAAYAKHLASDFGRPIDDRLNNRIQARDIAASREDANSLCRHEILLKSMKCISRFSKFIL
jgi:hypothetical protein